MLKKIKECNKRKIITKILASLLAIMLMFSNFTLLGSCIINGLVSYAADAEINNQDNKTNSENIVFEAYFMNEQGKKVYEADSDLNAEDTKLYISLGVKNKGYLKNAKIEFVDANFNFKNYENVVYSQGEEESNIEKYGTVKTIALANNQINAGETVSLKDDNSQEDGLTIRALTKSDSFNINSLKAISKIRLTGDYYEESNKESIKINSEKQIKINWDSQGITQENSPIKLEQELITNKILNVNEKNKRVVQLKIKSYLENNCYPIENTKIDIKLPKINNEYVEPEKITVASYGTIATNGKDSLNFAQEQEEVNTLGKWKYNKETQNIEINIKNSADENGNISWVKQGQDEFVVTYIYDEKIVINSITSEMSSKLNLYTGEQIESEKNLLEITEISEIANPLSIEINAPKELYKKNLRMNTPIEYKETWTIGLSNSEVIGIMSLLNLDVLNTTDIENLISDTTYKSTTVNKNDFINLLGKDGIIEIYESKSLLEEVNLIGEIKIDENLEGDTITFNYPENIKNVIIAFESKNNTLPGGKLNINHVKQIDSIDKEKIGETDKLDLLLTSVPDLCVNKLEAATSNVIDLKEPVLKAELGINLGREDKTTLPVNQENEIDFTVTLHTDKEEYKLYNNPIVKIDLPQEVTNMEILHLDILNANGLSIKDKKIEGKSIIVELEGNQEEVNDFNYINTQLQIKAKIKTKELMPTLTRDVKLTVINNQNEEDISSDVKKITFEQTTKGLILVNSISGYNNEKSEIIAIEKEQSADLAIETSAIISTVKGIIINNSEEQTRKLTVTGNIVKENATIEPKLKTAIQVENAKVYYSVDGQEWTENFENAKQYKIEFEQGLQPKETVEFLYSIEIPQNLKVNQAMEVYYSAQVEGQKEQSSQKIVLKTPQSIDLDVKITSSEKENSILFEGQRIKFNVEITNKSEVEAKNIKTILNLPEEFKLVEEQKIGNLQPRETKSLEIEVEVKDLSEDILQKEIKTSIEVTADNVVKKYKSEFTNIVKQSKILVTISDYYNDGGNIYENGQLKYRTVVENTSNVDIKNLNIVSNIPEHVQYIKDDVIAYEKVQILDSLFEEKEITNINVETKKQDNKIVYTVKELKANQKIVILLELKPNSLGNDLQRTVNYLVETQADNIEKYTTTKTDTVIRPDIKMETKLVNKTEPSRIENVNANDVLEYTTIISNNNNYKQMVAVEGKISTAVNLISLKYSVNDSEFKNVNVDANMYNINEEIDSYKELKLVLKVSVEKNTSKGDITIENLISSKARITNREGFGADTYVSEDTNIIKCILKAENKVEQEVEDNKDNTQNEENNKEEQKDDQQNGQTQKPNTENNATDKEKSTYKISGKAWLDEDKDGLIDKNEKLLKGVLVRIKKINQDKKAEYVKDEKGENIIAITDNNGNYEFKDLLQGEYILQFEYNAKDYTITPVSGKDSKVFVSTTQEGTIVKTDTLKLNSNIENINIGLILNGVFDLELNKYISKITVKNSSGTQVYNYDKTKLAKVEIKAKELNESIVMIEYQIDVTNKGEVNANSILVADYAPTELKFSSELNTTWYQKSDGTLCCTELTDKEIKPKETKSVKLVLTKTMTQSNTGIVNNTAEIAQAYNNSGLVDINSTPANKNQKENDFSNAEVIIGTATGSPIMYIAIVIISMLILGGGIYLINKKVIIKELI